MIYDNYKLNEIFNDTFPQLSWLKPMEQPKQSTRDEMINQAIEELYFLRLGGMTHKELYESCNIIRDVLLKLKEESCPVCDTLMCVDHLADE